jgi:zinc transporter ZupT
MKMVVLPASAATEAALDNLEASAKTAMEGTCTDVVSGGTINPSTCYNLVFKQDWWQSLYTINAANQANLAFFAQHFPTEFESTAHYLKDSSSDDIEPVAELPKKTAEAAVDLGFEWAGMFELPEDTYLWTAQKVVGVSGAKYADASMKMVAFSTAEADEASLHGLETAGKNALAGTCTDVTSGGTITPDSKCYRLVFKQEWWQSIYPINAKGVKHVAFFAEHVPTEFENTAHYLKDDHGDDIEPVAELPETAAAPTPAPTTSEDKKYWGEGIIASIIVNIVTLCGVVFLLPGLKTMSDRYREEFECVVAAFAAGAIGSCAFFLLLYESTHLIATEYTEEVAQIWRWGTMILAGALFPAVVHAGMEVAMKKTPSETGENKEEVDLSISRPRLISSVLIGDFMHNLCDGFFMGAAFKGCGSSFGWTVVWGTVGHEIAQELGDYLVLTSSECKIKPVYALCLNFLSGMGVLLGTIIVLAADVSQCDIGLILSFGGGVYLNIALIECMSKFQGAKVSGKVRAFGIVMFIIGCIAIGLILLKHEHCVPPAPPAPPVTYKPGCGPAPKPAGGHHH